MRYLSREDIVKRLAEALGIKKAEEIVDWGIRELGLENKSLFNKEELLRLMKCFQKHNKVMRFFNSEADPFIPFREVNPMDATRQKLWQIVDACETAALITTGLDGFPQARTMECLRLPLVEEIWFCTDVDEQKLKEIQKEPRVGVFFSLPDKSWAVVGGTAEVVTDPDLKKRFWREEWGKYFPGGYSIPGYVLIRIVPVAARYLLRQGYQQGRIKF